MHAKNHPVDGLVMDYSRLFSPEDITIPIPNPSQHPSAPLQMLRRESYNTMTDGMTGSAVGAAGHAQGQLVSPMEEVEELDTSSRPRLTQEQIAILEDQFKGKPKPGTEFKKHLASQIGLSLQRVNASVPRRFCAAGADVKPRIGIKTAAPRLGTKDHRREGLMFYRRTRTLNGVARTWDSRTSIAGRTNFMTLLFLTKSLQVNSWPFRATIQPSCPNLIARISIGFWTPVGALEVPTSWIAGPRMPRRRRNLERARPPTTRRTQNHPSRSCRNGTSVTSVTGFQRWIWLCTMNTLWPFRTLLVPTRMPCIKTRWRGSPGAIPRAIRLAPPHLLKASQAS